MGELIGKGKKMGVVLRALVLSYFITTVLLLIAAFVMLKLQPDVKLVEAVVLGIYVCSCFGGGWYAGRKAERRKFLMGLFVGICYFALLFLISGLGERAIQSDVTQGLLAFVLCALGGMLGGIVTAA